MISIFSQSKPIVPVVDLFTTKMIDIDGDKIPDTSHGEVIKRLCKASLPGVNVVEFNVESKKKNEFGRPQQSTEKLLTAFSTIRKWIDKGKDVAAVNLSLGAKDTIKGLIKWTGMYDDFEINKDTVADLKDHLKSYYVLRNHRIPTTLQKIFLKDVAPNPVTAIESITSQNVPVYISAGNDSKDTFNLYSLADGATIVSGKDQNGNDELFADNAIVNRREPAFIITESIKNDKGKIIGYDINQDGIADYNNNEVSGKGKLDYKGYIVGTSISAPNALIKDLLT